MPDYQSLASMNTFAPMQNALSGLGESAKMGYQVKRQNMLDQVSLAQLGEVKRKSEMERFQVAGKYAKMILGLPEEQRPQAYEAATQQLERIFGKSDQPIPPYDPEKVEMIAKAYDQINPDEDKLPNETRAWENYDKLPSEEKKREYLRWKRAQLPVDIGNAKVFPDPLDPAKAPVASYDVGLKPGELPQVRGAQTAAVESAKTAAAGPQKEAEVTGKGIGENNMAQYQAATAAVSQVEDIDRLIGHIDTSKAITGMGSELLKNIERTKALLGSKAAAGKVSDTELLDTMMGSEVFPMIKSLGVGARGMDTPAEREFMRSVLTGALPLNKETLRKMAETRKNIATRAIDKWNTRTEKGELDRFYDAAGLPKEPIQYKKTQPKGGSTAPPPGAVRKQVNGKTGEVRYLDAQGNPL